MKYLHFPGLSLFKTQLYKYLASKSFVRNITGPLETRVTGIEGKIPSQASTTNQLADKAFVNSSISTNTGEFKGTYDSLQALETAAWDANANDYGFVRSVDGQGNTVFDRYKFVQGVVRGNWVYEYTLNNSSFTAAQWEAINSGATEELVGRIEPLWESIRDLDGSIEDMGIEVAQLSGRIDAERAHADSLIFDVTKENSGSTFASLSALLSSPDLSTLIPTSVRTGGMTIRFVLTSDNKYVQYRLMANSFSTTPSNWQGVDDEPTAGSENLVKSVGVVKYTNRLFIDRENSNDAEYWSLVKEIYVTNQDLVGAIYIKLSNVARNVNGVWYVQFEAKKRDETIQRFSISPNFEPNGIKKVSNFGYVVLDWKEIPNNVQSSIDITLNNKIFDLAFSASISSYLKNQRINNVTKLGGCYEIDNHYIHTSTASGVPSGSAVVGTCVEILSHNSFHITRFRVSAGQKLYVPYKTGIYTLNPIVVDDNDIVLQVGNQSLVDYNTDIVVINDGEYWKFEVEQTGILVYSKRKTDSEVILSADDSPCLRNDILYEYVLANNSGQWLNFVKECHVNGTKSQFFNLHISNIARNKNGYWYIAFTWGEEGSETQTSVSFTSEQEIVKFYYQERFIIYLAVNWDAIPNTYQESTNIYFSDKAFEYTDLFEINDNINSLINSRKIFKNLVFGTTGRLEGYVKTSTNDGTPFGNLGEVITYSGIGSSFYHIRIPIAKNETVYVPYVSNNYITKNPIVVDELDTLLQIGNMTLVETDDLISFGIDGDGGFQYWAFTSEYDGYLIFSHNSDFGVFSDKPSTRPSRSKEDIKQSLNKLIGTQIILGTESAVPFDFEVARTMNHTMLKSLVETASNGSCTVLYDTNSYPNLMFKIPLMTIGALAPTLGDLETPHPAFVVDGTIKRHVYAAVFMNSTYNEVPVSWFGVGTNMRSKSFFECRTLCAEKGTGWHLETIWERSLISLLSAKYHNNRPRGNNCWGRSRITGFEYECIERVDGNYPGQHSNGCQWYDGTQPNTWSHNNSRWGIFDVIGGYHEWCNLAKVVDGQIFLSADNKYDAEESEWVATGAYIGFSDGKVKYSNIQWPVVAQIELGDWSSAICDSGYDSLNLDVRKKLALSLMCPRLSSEDTQPIFSFDGSIWVRRNDEIGYTTYPFLGGAEEYADSGLGFNILSYTGTEAHNNMGSRIFYID